MASIDLSAITYSENETSNNTYYKERPNNNINRNLKAVY